MSTAGQVKGEKGTQEALVFALVERAASEGRRCPTNEICARIRVYEALGF